MHGVILYGPPAAGKDTVTNVLSELRPEFRLFPRVKVGSGRTRGYRMTSAEEAQAMRVRGEVVWENSRYGATYLIDRPFLLDHLRRFITVIHLGQVPAVAAVLDANRHVGWQVVTLWCPRDVAAERIRLRATGDDVDRLTAWDATENLPDADLLIDTSKVTAEDAARQIIEQCEKNNASIASS